MDEYLEPRGGWKTFNQFFARNFKPGFRPIDGLCDPNVIMSPAHSTFDECFPITPSSTVMIKNVEWPFKYSLDESEFFDHFEGGIFMHMFLNVFVYHRQHTPVEGKVLEARLIPGQAFLQVVVKCDPKTGRRYLKGQRCCAEPTASDDAGYQFLQCRGLFVIENDILGKVAVLPIGMAQVSSVVLTAEKGMTLRKGEELSYFHFGGSDIVLVFQAHTKVNLTAIKDNHYNIGESDRNCKR